MAKDTIYIHDWWLSPELYLRRPAEGNQHWRLDRLLKRKAEEGIKIFIILYRNVGNFVPIDSLYSKHSLLNLHKNIFVMRSPNQLLQNTFFWAHHEKLCLIDNTVAFLGGIDLCYARWDTPDHVLVDDGPIAFYKQANEIPGYHNPKISADTLQIWPGKDYSNPRVQDFFALDRPYEDMYDRNKVPRMPWHDVHMMVSGQPARDLIRHFVQRWNYLLRQKRPSRWTPMLLPPPDLTIDQVEQLNLGGSCEVQILRSSGGWSLGLNEFERSIQNAYLKSIEQSEHFVYIENQFFITSTSLENTVVENKIGDALVERIIRAHEKNELWRAVIVIPLMPGFESQVDHPDGSSVRVIMQCQYMSISRGPNSIMGRLEKAGIRPDEYIQFCSLRKWGKIGPNRALVTEQLYIHAKTMIVDDRIAIIGSANINERSMRGSRDSEVAAIVRDTDQIDSFMGGTPYKVGRFAHSLRVRLMREHLGVDIDQVDLIEHEAELLEIFAVSDTSDTLADLTMNGRNAHPKNAREEGQAYRDIDPLSARRLSIQSAGSDRSYLPTEAIELTSFNNSAGVDNKGMREKKQLSKDLRVQNNSKHQDDVNGLGVDGMASVRAEQIAREEEDSRHNSNRAGVKLKQKAKQKVKQDEESQKHPPNDASITKKAVVDLLAENNTFEDIVDFKRTLYQRIKQAGELDEPSTAANFSSASSSNSLASEFEDKPSETLLNGASASNAVPKQNNNRYFVDPYALEDPLDDEFYYDIWLRIAEKNTSLFRQVFRCQPDDEVTNWKEYKEYVAYGNKFAMAQEIVETPLMDEKQKFTNSNAPLGNLPEMAETDLNEEKNNPANSERSSSDSIQDESPESQKRRGQGDPETADVTPALNSEATSILNTETNTPDGAKTPNNTSTGTQASAHHSRPRRRRAGTRSSRNRFRAGVGYMPDPQTAERLLQGVRGHLVIFPTDWLCRELETGNWFYNLDRIPPVEIYD